MRVPPCAKMDQQSEHPRARHAWHVPIGRVATPLRRSREHATRFCCIAVHSLIILGLSRKTHGGVLITMRSLFCRSHPYCTRLNRLVRFPSSRVPLSQIPTRASAPTYPSYAARRTSTGG